MILKLGIDHQGLKVYKVCINDNPGLNMTYFTARSNLVNDVGFFYQRRDDILPE